MKVEDDLCLRGVDHLLICRGFYMPAAAFYFVNFCTEGSQLEHNG
jgi:hypothetical protein